MKIASSCVFHSFSLRFIYDLKNIRATTGNAYVSCQLWFHFTRVWALVSKLNSFLVNIFSLVTVDRAHYYCFQNLRWICERFISFFFLLKKAIKQNANLSWKKEKHLYLFIYEKQLHSRAQSHFGLLVFHAVQVFLQQCVGLWLYKCIRVPSCEALGDWAVCSRACPKCSVW